MTDVALDEPNNQVVLGVSRALTAEEAADLKRRFGSALRAEVHSLPRTTGHRGAEPLPMKGGMELNRFYSQLGVNYKVTCTSSFSAYQDYKDPLDPFVTKRRFATFTAGHCGYKGDQWFHNGTGIGVGSVENSFQSALRAISLPAGTPRSDSQTIGSVAGRLPSNRVLLNAAGSYQRITASQGFNNDVVGESVCFAGVTSEVVKCGALQSRNVTVTYRNEPVPGSTPRDITLYNQRAMSPASIPGDSGSAVYSGVTAKGIMSGTNGSSAFYSQIQHAFDETGWRVLTYQP